MSLILSNLNAHTFLCKKKYNSRLSSSEVSCYVRLLNDAFRVYVCVCVCVCVRVLARTCMRVSVYYCLMLSVDQLRSKREEERRQVSSSIPGLYHDTNYTAKFRV